MQKEKYTNCTEYLKQNRLTTNAIFKVAKQSKFLYDSIKSEKNIGVARWVNQSNYWES